MRTEENCCNDIILAWSYAALGNKLDNAIAESDELKQAINKISNALLGKGSEYQPSLEDFVDIYSVPEIVYTLSENNDKLHKLNKRIKSLQPEFQKLLHFIISDHAPGIISESMGYSSDVQYWERRKECLGEFLGPETDLDNETKNDLQKIYQRYIDIRDLFLINTDTLLKQRTKKKNQRKWIITSLTSISVTILFFVFAYPKLLQKDYEFLFDYAAKSSDLYVTIDSTDYIDQLIMEQEEYSPEQYWLLTIKSLQERDSRSCINNLKSLKASDPDLYAEKGRYIYNRLRR